MRFNGLLLLLLLLFSCSPSLVNQETYYQITANTLNIRSDSNSDSRVIGKLNKGDKVKIIDKSNSEWYLIEFNNIKGYVSAPYLEPVQFGRKERTKQVAIYLGIGLFVLLIVGLLVINGGGSKSNSNVIQSPPAMNENKNANYPLLNPGMAVFLAFIFPYIGTLYSGVSVFLKSLLFLILYGVIGLFAMAYYAQKEPATALILYLIGFAIMFIFSLYWAYSGAIKKNNSRIKAQ